MPRICLRGCANRLWADHDHYHLGCDRARIPDWLVFDKLFQVLVFGGPFLEPPHLDRGYDYARTPNRPAAFRLVGNLARRESPAPVAASERRAITRTHAWLNAFEKLVWCTERRARMLRFWLAFAGVGAIVRWLIRQSWICYWRDGRPTRHP